MKICGKCKVEKNLDEFYLVKNGKKNNKQVYYSKCRECTKVDNAKRTFRPGFHEKENARRKYLMDNNPEYASKVKQWKKASRDRRLPQADMYFNALRRAKKYDLEFNLVLEDIIIPELCPYLGVPIIKGTKSDYEYTPSLDRFDNSKGYTKDNIIVVSKKGNSMKNSATLEELKTFCTNMLTILNNKDIVQTNVN